MKMRALFFVAGLAIAAGFSTLAFAEEMPEMDNQNQAMQGGPGQGPGGKMNPMMMHKDSIIATSDGGVVVLSGPRLIKYDKDLTLVKEVEMPKGKGPGPRQQQQQQPSDDGTASATT